MVNDDEDPRELVSQEMKRTPKLVDEREQSQERAATTRKWRIMNGWDELFADLLGGRA